MLQRLLAARGPSGSEGEVRLLVKEAAKPLADEITVDALGSVLAKKNGTDASAPHVLLCAHMDEVGFQIQAVTEDGLLRYAMLGGIDPVVLASKRVVVGKNSVPGVIGSKAVHLQERGEYEKPYRHKDLYIDIGAKDKKDALTKVSVGDFATFDGDIVEFGDGLIKSRALDDRVGCYALLRLMEKTYPCAVTYAFTVQEEAGLRGATAVGNRVLPDLAIALEGTTAGDVGDAESYEEVCRVGSGPAISFMDLSSVSHRPLVRALCDAGSKAGIPWQVKRYVSGGNDAGAIQRAGEGTRTAVVSVPCRYIHSPASVCSKADIDNMIALLDAFLASGAKI